MGSVESIVCDVVFEIMFPNFSQQAHVFLVKKLTGSPLFREVVHRTSGLSGPMQSGGNLKYFVKTKKRNSE